MKKYFLKIITITIFSCVFVFLPKKVMGQAPKAPAAEASSHNVIEITSETFDDLNPLIIGGAPDDVVDELSSPGGIISRLLNFLFPLAGMILFLLISWGGFEMLTSASSKEGMEAGKNRVTAAIIGFILLFSTYWMAQIVELIFRIKIL